VAFIFWLAPWVKALDIGRPWLAAKAAKDRP
jgi:hypothetical protein